MPEHDHHSSTSDVTGDDACAVLEPVLAGPARGEILDWVLEGQSFSMALKRLRSGMRTHVFRTAAGPLSLRDMIFQLDMRTREEGFHVFHPWDFADHRFSKDNLPTLMLDHCSSYGPAVPETRATLAILLDNYFLHVLALCTMRAWDGANADATFDRLTDLVGHLQGPRGSGQQFVGNAETLLVLAVSHYHPEEQVYDDLVKRVKTLTEAHQVHFALMGSAVLGSHLRWGFALMYKRDLGVLREDNVADYPWLLASLATLAREYARLKESGIDGAVRENVVDSLLNGLSPDPWAFVDEVPASLADHTTEHAELYRFLNRYREDLLAEFEGRRPDREKYAPLSFHTNFLPNTLVGMVMTALLQGSAHDLPLDALFLASWPGEPDMRGVLARALAYYAGSRVERVDDHGAALIVYDEGAGMRHVNMTLQAMRKHLPG
jgi:hypothetical protein